MIKNIMGELDQNKTDPHDAIIWNNSDVKIEGQPIFFTSHGIRWALIKLNTCYIKTAENS